MNPSSGENPPERINSKSHNCRSVKCKSGNVSTSFNNFSRIGASLTIRSFSSPPCGSSAIFGLIGQTGGEELYQRRSAARSQKFRDRHGAAKWRAQITCRRMNAIAVRGDPSHQRNKYVVSCVMVSTGLGEGLNQREGNMMKCHDRSN